MRAPLDRLDDAIRALLDDTAPRSSSSGPWGDVLWAAALAVQVGEDPEAVEQRLRDLPLPIAPAPPCSCLRWTDWLRQQKLTTRAWSNTLNFLHNERNATGCHAGCPVRAWLVTLHPAAPTLLPLRCSQRLICTPDGLALLLPPSRLTPLATLRVDPDGTGHLEDGTRLRPGDTFPLGELTAQLRADTLTVARLSNPPPRRDPTFLPITQTTTRLPPPERLHLIRHNDACFELYHPHGPLTLGVSPLRPALPEPHDTATVGDQTLSIERWPQHPDPAPDLQSTLLHLRDALATPHPNPRTLHALCDQATLASLTHPEGELALDYLAAHLHSLPPPYERPACPCEDWQRCLRNTPDHHTPRAAWLDDLLGVHTQLSKRARPARPKRACPKRAWLIADRWSPAADHFAVTLGCAQRLALHPEHPTLTTLPLRADPALPLLTLLPSGDALLRLPGDDATRLTHGDTLHLHDLAFTFYTHNPPGTLEPLDLPHAEPARIDRPVFTLGRHDDCDYILPHSTISKRHIELLYRDGQLWGADLGSANGFYVNQRRAAPQQPLRDQDLLQLGALRFKLHWPGGA